MRVLRARYGLLTASMLQEGTLVQSLRPREAPLGKTSRNVLQKRAPAEADALRQSFPNLVLNAILDEGVFGLV